MVFSPFVGYFPIHAAGFAVIAQLTVQAVPVERTGRLRQSAVAAFNPLRVHDFAVFPRRTWCVVRFAVALSASG
jgi:hypothetical protein